MEPQTINEALIWKPSSQAVDRLKTNLSKDSLTNQVRGKMNSVPHSSARKPCSALSFNLRVEGREVSRERAESVSTVLSNDTLVKLPHNITFSGFPTSGSLYKVV